MPTLTEIEMAIPHLDMTELSRLERLVHSIRFVVSNPSGAALLISHRCSLEK